MKTQMRDTSILAWYQILENLGERQVKVYKAIKDLKFCSNTMISQHLNLPINCITGRVNELRKYNVVRMYKKDICPITKKRVIFWSIKRRFL